MSYEKIRIRKLQNAGTFPFPQLENLTNLALKEMLLKRSNDSLRMVSGTDSLFVKDLMLFPSMTKKIADTSKLTFDSTTNKIEGLNITDQEVTPEEMFGNENQSDQSASNYSPVEYESTNRKEEQMRKATAAMSIVGNAANIAINQVDQATMGDKNFSASSQAIDAGVHGLSGMMMNSGNPYVMAAGVALEGLNFATKAGGRNVQGYDVNINNAGYGNLGHQESEAGRIWDKWSGATAQKLRRRNELARMALAAQNISEEQNYQREARVNSVDNILRQNQIALAGGIDTGLLGN